MTECETLQNELSRELSNSPIAAHFIEVLNEVIDLHTSRVDDYYRPTCEKSIVEEWLYIEGAQHPAQAYPANACIKIVKKSPVNS